MKWKLTALLSHIQLWFGGYIGQISSLQNNAIQRMLGWCPRVQCHLRYSGFFRAPWLPWALVWSSVRAADSVLLMHKRASWKLRSIQQVPHLSSCYCMRHNHYSDSLDTDHSDPWKDRSSGSCQLLLKKNAEAHLESIELWIGYNKPPLVWSQICIFISFGLKFLLSAVSEKMGFPSPFFICVIVSKWLYGEQIMVPIVPSSIWLLYCVRFTSNFY